MALRGTFTFYRSKLKARARDLRRESTAAEQKLWFGYLRGLDAKFTRQKPLDAYIADFYCARHRLIIEVDGDSHYSANGEEHDRRREQALRRYDVRVLRFTNREVMEEFEGVCGQIAEALK